MSATDRLALPHLLPGQSQKELFHNEALQVLDLIVGATVEEPPRAAPPVAPIPGACYIVAATPTGAWAGHANCLAGMTSAGWRYVAPFEGLTALVRTIGVTAAYRSGTWELGTLRGDRLHIDAQQVVGPRGSAIATPAAGTVVDVEARANVSAILAALRQHGLNAP